MKRLLAVGLIGLAALISFGAGIQGELFGRSHGPSGKVLHAKPTLVWEVWSTLPGEIVGARAQIGGRTYAARYDTRLRQVVVDLDRPLLPGEHRITVWAKLRDGDQISKSWTISVPSNALPDLPPANASQFRALDAVNRFRNAMGLPNARMDDRLNTASLYHSRYLEANNGTGHYEREGRPGFVAVEPGDRHAAFGWVGSSWECVAYGANDEPEAIQDLIDAPYHRIPFIQPGEISFGSGAANMRLTTAFSMSEQTGTVVHPYDRQQDVPVLWAHRERPDPLRIHSGAKRPVGYPIMLVHFSKDTVKLDVDSATLRDARGGAVPCLINTPRNDDELTNAVIIMPESPLQANSWYTASVKGSIPGLGSFAKTWSFKTAAARSKGQK